MSSVLRYAIKEVAGEAAESSAIRSFRTNIIMDSVGTQQRQTIAQALGQSGYLPKANFIAELDEIPEAALEKGLVKTAQTNPEQFGKVMKQLSNGDEASKTALRKFYKDNPSLQSQIKAGVGDNADTFFKGMDGSVRELSESQINNLGAAQGITRAGFAAADGGKKFFTKVWDSIASGRALNTARFGFTVGVAWVVIDVLASLTGQTKLEFFSDLFEFIKDPSASLFADDDGGGINGSWQLTGLGKMVFGTVAIFGIAIAVKLVKTLTPSEA